MKSLPAIEQWVLAQKLPIELIPPLGFKVNEHRKESPLRAVCLTVFSRQETPRCILKMPLTEDPMANALIQKEVEILQAVGHQAPAQTVPKPLRLFSVENRRVSIVTYLPNELIYQKLNRHLYATYQSPAPFPAEWVEKPLNWLLAFQTAGAHRQEEMTPEFLARFFDAQKQRLAPEQTAILNWIRTVEKEPFPFGMRVPVGLIHGDFNIWNIGLQTMESGEIPAVLDFEDAEDAPLLFDLFYFMCGWVWQAFLYPKSLSHAYIETMMDTLTEHIRTALAAHMAQFGFLTEDQLLGLFKLFLVRNCALEGEAKRRSGSDLVDRWTAVYHLAGQADTFLDVLNLQKQVLKSLIN